MADKKTNPVAKEVSFDATDAIAQFVDLVKALPGLSTVLEIENRLSVPLNRITFIDGFHPASGSHGSGDFPDNAPIKKLDAQMEGLTAIESAGAGAIALVIYQVGASDVYIVFYTAQPKVGKDVGCCSIFYGPDFSKWSHEDWLNVGNSIMGAMDQLSHRTSNTVKGLGLEVEYTLTGIGQDTETANFVVRDRSDGRESFTIYHNKQKKYVGGAPEPILDGGEFTAPALPSSQVTCLNQAMNLTNPKIWEWNYDGDKPDFSNVRIVTSGQDDQFYLNYRGIGGRVKLYDDISTSHWKVDGRTAENNKIQFYSIDHGEWMRADDDQECYVDVDDESDLDSAWIVKSVSYK